MLKQTVIHTLDMVLSYNIRDAGSRPLAPDGGVMGRTTVLLSPTKLGDNTVVYSASVSAASVESTGTWR